jgi:hypothetical protein
LNSLDMLKTPQRCSSAIELVEHDVYLTENILERS